MDNMKYGVVIIHNLMNKDTQSFPFPLHVSTPEGLGGRFILILILNIAITLSTSFDNVYNQNLQVINTLQQYQVIYKFMNVGGDEKRDINFVWPNENFIIPKLCVLLIEMTVICVQKMPVPYLTLLN